MNLINSTGIPRCFLTCSVDATTPSIVLKVRMKMSALAD
jgi:hypothetical protein